MNMTCRVALAALVPIAAGCARMVGRSAEMAEPPCCRAAGLRIAERHGVKAIDARRFTHATLWEALAPHLGAGGLRVADVGRSSEGRAIRAVTFGTGATRVLLWSQMHGDESSATMALADLIAWFAAPSVEDDALRRRLASELTIVMVPMLNPDGAERFERRNAMNVDVNRDALDLVTPEARALEALRDSLRPDFGFNLHDQNANTLAGRGGPQAAISLLAPATDASRSWNAVRSRARLLAADIAAVVARELPGRVARYDDTFEPRAFGDVMQQRGTSTVLIETGALPGDPEKQRLRAINVVAILTALDAIATRRLGRANPRFYEALPGNVRGGTSAPCADRAWGSVADTHRPRCARCANGSARSATCRPSSRWCGRPATRSPSARWGCGSCARCCPSPRCSSAS